jgi:hypothetical protein
MHYNVTFKSKQVIASEAGGFFRFSLFFFWLCGEERSFGGVKNEGRFHSPFLRYVTEATDVVVHTCNPSTVRLR